MIPFNKPYIIGKELYYIAQTVQNSNLAGDGEFTRKCCEWMEKQLGGDKVLLTHSCTAALEMAAILCDIQPGDEVIMPSYTFVSTANAFVLRGGVPVFVDIRPDTLNIDENKIEEAITKRTKAIVPVHYAGVACEMDKIMEIAERHNLIVIEDAAQGVCSSYKGKSLGTIGHLGCYSFHETKNFISGEGGALVVNDRLFSERAEIIREKGTNRNKFFRGEVDKYTWVDTGSNYLASELVAAFLLAQLEKSDKITEKRRQIWNRYFQGLARLEEEGFINRPVIPEETRHNAHMFYILTKDLNKRTTLIKHLRDSEIYSVFHYIPLHSSPAGIKFGRTRDDLPVTNEISDRVLRLPCFYELSENDQDFVIESIIKFYSAQAISLPGSSVKL